MSSLWIILVSWLATVILSVAGQSTTVTQCIPSFNWSLNSLQQNPCLVAAFLESSCGQVTDIPALPNNTVHYLGPTAAQANPCLCSSVTYSMISACAGCQGGPYIDWLTWSQDCTQVTVTTFPKPLASAVVIPTWANLNISQTNNNFSVLAAEQAANSVSTSSSSSIASSTSATSSPTPSTSASAGKSKSDAGAIAGGVVGGLVFLAVVVLGALWFCVRKKRSMVQKNVAFDSRALVSGTTMTNITGPSPSQPSQSLYTSDMSTYLGSPITTSAVLTSGVPPSRRSLESLSLSVAQFGGGPQNRANVPLGYMGMPEV